MGLAATRLVQLLGLLLAAFGLWSYWNATDPAAAAPLSEVEAALVDPGGDSFKTSFVIAGRDILYTQVAGPPIYDARGRVIGRQRPARGTAYGTNTDSIFYVQIVGNKVYMIAIPRDIWLPEHQIKVNSVIAYRHLGADGLRREVSKLIGLPIEHYAIINVDIFERVVDAIGGVEVDIPVPMHYDDHAAGLHIHFDPGRTHLSGADAANFVRYRRTLPGTDLGRIDNIKRLAAAMLGRVRQQGIRAAAALPELVNTLFEEVETSADPALALQLLRRLGELEIVAATLPARDSTVWVDDRQLGRIRIDIQVPEPREVEAFLASTFGGQARTFAEAPEAGLLISNRSGRAGLEDLVKARLVAFGVPEARILTQELPVDPLPTRLQAEREGWNHAAYYANMMGLERSQVYRINRPQGVAQGPGQDALNLELVLGQDAVQTLFPALADEPVHVSLFHDTLAEDTLTDDTLSDDTPSDDTLTDDTLIAREPAASGP